MQKPVNFELEAPRFRIFRFDSNFQHTSFSPTVTIFQCELLKYRTFFLPYCPKLCRSPPRLKVNLKTIWKKKTFFFLPRPLTPRILFFVSCVTIYSLIVTCDISLFLELRLRQFLEVSYGIPVFTPQFQNFF